MSKRDIERCGRSGGHLATINYSLDPDGFKDIDLPQSFLDPLNKQSGYAEALLRLFNEKAVDKEFIRRLERHHAMMKEKFNTGRRPKNVFFTKVREFLRKLFDPKPLKRR